MQKNKCISCGKKLTGHGKPKRCLRCSARERYVRKHGRPPMRIRIICEMCKKEKLDYLSNHKKSRHKTYFCSNKCRAKWTGIHNSIIRGGDGLRKSKSEKDGNYYRINVKKIRKQRKSYYRKNRIRILAQKKESDRKAKQAVINAYGGKCECCGETIIEFLTIDHTKNDGAIHRRKIGKKNVYKDLIKRGFPKDGYRILCFNCNITRGFYGYCPHHLKEKSSISHKPFHAGRKRIIAG